jgi:hypothetical protein
VLHSNKHANPAHHTGELTRHFAREIAFNILLRIASNRQNNSARLLGIANYQAEYCLYIPKLPHHRASNTND